MLSKCAVHTQKYPRMVSLMEAHLHGPPGSIALINQALVLLHKLPLLLKSPQSDQPRQSFAELAEDWGQVDGVQPLQLPVGSYVQVLDPDVEEDEWNGCYEDCWGDKEDNC